MDPRLLSLDIETYGKWSKMPPQTCFTPFRSFYIDGVPYADQVLTCSLTIPSRDPRSLSVAAATSLTSSSGTWSSPAGPASSAMSVRPPSPTSFTAKDLASLEPGPTMVLGMRKEDPAGDYHKLIGWLGYADTLIGMNIQFDLLYLRASRPMLREILVPFRHLLIDLSVVNFLEFEGRPERSLKTLGPVLGAYTYRQEDLQVLPRMSDIRSYNAQDTHNTLTAVSILARRILRSFPDSDKLSPDCLQFYSDTIWSCILMTEAGVPFHRPSLLSLHHNYLSFVERVEHILHSRFGLSLSGEGSDKSKQAFLEAAMDEALRCAPEAPVRQDPQFVLTPEKHQPSFCDNNRSLIASRLPPAHPLAGALRLIDAYTLRQKILSTYLWPLLFGARKNPENRSKLLVPTRVTHPIGVPQCRKSSKPPTPSSAFPDPSRTTSGRYSPIGRTPTPTLRSHRSSSSGFVTARDPTPSPGSPSFPPTPAPDGLSPCPAATVPPPSSTPRSGGHLSRPEVPTRLSSETQLSHPSWFVVPSRFKDDAGSSGGTIQARLTCKDGAHQTDPPPIQACRASRWVGGIVVGYDASQIELRVPAVLSGEPSMVSEYLKAKPDLHTAMTVALFGDTILSHPDFKKGIPSDPRQVGKTANFLILFRGGPDKLQATLLEATGVLHDLRLCQELVARAKASRPRLWAWQDSLIKEAETKGVLILPLTGQSRTFMGGDKYEVNEIVNYPVQSHAANAIRDVMHRAARAISRDPSILLFLNVYDALYFDCADQAAVDRLDTIMNQAVADSSQFGYWDALCSLTGHRIPLIFGRKVA